jgi:hypothetical protein
MHVVLAFVSLCFIGFVSMITDVVAMTISYSGRLAPRTSTTIVYLTWLVLSIYIEVRDAFNA